MTDRRHANNTPVEYYDRDRNQWVPARVIGHGYENGWLVYDVVIDHDQDQRWGYADQVRPRV